jgi:ferritin-like metal-binding protein YciE
MSDPDNHVSAQSDVDDLHDRIQSRLDELHADFKQLEVDVHAANQASVRARKDRIEGFKRALRDILQAADRAEREWS